MRLFHSHKAPRDFLIHQAGLGGDVWLAYYYGDS